MTASFVDAADADLVPTFQGEPVTVTLASTPDPNDLLIAVGTWSNSGGADDGFPHVPAGWAELSPRPPTGGSFFNQGTWAHVWCRVADGTETELSVLTGQNVAVALVTVARLAGTLLAAGWNDSQLVAAAGPNTVFGTVDMSGFTTTVDDDGIGLAYACMSSDSDPGAATVDWTEGHYAVGNATIAQKLWTAPLVAATPLAGPDATGGSSTSWAGRFIGLVQVGTHLPLLVADAGGRQILMPRKTGLALVPPAPQRRQLAKNPPEPAPRVPSASPWVPKSGQYRPPV